MSSQAAAGKRPGSVGSGSKNATYDHLVKLLVIGDSGVGKSCLLLRFCDDSFTPSFITTIGIDYKIRTVEMDGKRIKLQIWDTAGQERFRTITSAYYRGAMGIMLVYDVSDERSFNNIRNWIRNVEQNATEGVNMILVGNKCDMSEKRAVSKERGQALADEFGIDFLETSAMNSTNVDEAFVALTQSVKKRLIDSQLLDKEKSGGVKLQQSAYERFKTSCCYGGGSSGDVEPKEQPGASITQPPKSPSRSVRSNRSGGQNSTPGSPK